MDIVNDTSYEPFAEDYLSKSNDNFVLNHYERPYITSQLPEMNNLTVLDVGCATGFYSRYCQDRGAKIICVDASQKMVKHTVELCNGKAEGHVHDIAQPMSFMPSDSANVIICSLVLHYVEQWEGVLSEFHRILKKGGICVISTHHPVNDFTRFNQENYFRTRLIEDEWENFGKPLRVKYHVRPLSKYIELMLNSELALTKVTEPMPSDELEELHEKFYRRLREHPLFLFFILEKKTDA